MAFTVAVLHTATIGRTALITVPTLDEGLRWIRARAAEMDHAVLVEDVEGDCADIATGKDQQIELYTIEPTGRG